MRDEDVAILKSIMKACEDLTTRKYQLKCEYYRQEAIVKLFELKKILDAFDKVIDKLYDFIKNAKTSDYDAYTNIERVYMARYDCTIMQLKAA